MWDAVALGECMVELSLDGGRGAAVGYAGDTFNTAVYLSRLGVPTAYGTAIGRGDPFSAGILDLMREEGVAADLVVAVEGRLPGLYAIQRDAAGERRFFYWREAAPARDFLRLADPAALAVALNGAKVVYLSAISLAIVGAEGRARLLPLLLAAAQAGAGLALDTNYRARLWPDPAAAREAVEQLAPHCRWISAGVDDLSAMGADPQACAESWAARGAEVILRGTDRAVEVRSAGVRQQFAPEAVAPAVDTTGAGDAFNAAYLAARLRGAEIAEAVTAARRLASIVVQHRGAIIPRPAMPA